MALTLSGAAGVGLGVACAVGFDAGVLTGAAAAAVLIGHGVLVAGSPFLVPSLTHGSRRSGAVALTFDDGPHPVFTPLVLDLLARHGAHATFFCIGRQARTHPEIVRRAVAGGHAVGSHTYSHRRDLLTLPPSRLEAEVRLGARAVARAAGAAPVLFRAPMGLVNPWVDLALRDLGLVLVAWSAHARDNAPRPDPAAHARTLAARLRPGDIVLLHDGADRGSARTCAARRTYTLALLEALLPALAKRGLASVPVTALDGGRPS